MHLLVIHFDEDLFAINQYDIVMYTILLLFYIYIYYYYYSYDYHSFKRFD